MLSEKKSEKPKKNEEIIILFHGIHLLGSENLSKLSLILLRNLSRKRLQIIKKMKNQWMKRE